nr:hypothetical protein [Lactiplantibacillus pentosus]
MANLLLSSRALCNQAIMDAFLALVKPNATIVIIVNSVTEGKRQSFTTNNPATRI